ncbi:DedA family protein [Alcaligenaceae bacterium SJ-26]|nr:DedA family protein [Alcaligenaceae bacterium SJ-26]
MEAYLSNLINDVLAFLSLPEIGLSAIFTVSLVSATLLPLGSEPAVFGYLKLAPDMFWPAVVVATAGNTIGGAISYAMGLWARLAVLRWKRRRQQQMLAERAGDAGDLTVDVRPTRRLRGKWEQRARQWLRRMGPPALLLSWLPGVGDPLCAVAGWLRLSFWPCVMYMAIGKFARYVIMTAVLLWVWPNGV